MIRAMTIAAAAGAALAAVSIPMGTEFGCSIGCWTNIAPGLRTWVNAYNGSQNSAVDSEGWPTSDAFTVLFDNRAVPAWAPPIDDPWAWQAPMNGTYYFNFTGKADVNGGSDPSASFSILNVTFDPATWTTAGYILLPPGAPDLVEFNVTNTVRVQGGATNTGIANLVVMRPGYWGDGNRTWAPELLAMLPPFSHIRFMGHMGTNTNPGYYGDVGHHVYEWTDRCYPDDSMFPNNLRTGCVSNMAWEHVVQVSQASGKGVWVNLPISATLSAPPGQAANLSTFAGQWAQLFKSGNAATGNAGIPDAAPIYVEHSNEVWNFGFGQYVYNKLAAIDECNATAHPGQPCLWANDGSTDQEKWAQRRHLGKVYELAKTFEAVFGPGSIPGKVRPIYAEWPLFPDRYNDTLTWAAATYPEHPSTWLYGMAITGYFGGTAEANMTLDQIYADYKNSSDNQYKTRQTFASIAASWGIKVVAYEAGPGWSVGTTKSVGQYILAQRFAPMRDAVAYDVASSWVPAGCADYNFFSLVGDYSRYGMWGAAEWFFNATTPKYCALLDLTGTALPQGCQY